MAIAAGTPQMTERRLSGVLGITTETQARLDSGLMRGRLPLPVAIYLLCMVIPVWFFVGPLYLSTLRLLLLVMTLPLLIGLLSGRYGRMILTDWLFLAHIAWATVAMAVNSPDRVVEQMGSVGTEFIGGYLLGRAYIRTPETFLALCRWLVAIVLILLPFTIHESRVGAAIMLELIRGLPGIETFAKVPPDPRMGLFRAQTVFAHPIHHGLFCSIAFSLAFVALKGVVSDTRRWISAGLIAAAGFLGLSSGAWLAILLQMGLIIWATAFDRITWRWWLLVGFFVVAYVVVDVLSNRTPIRVFMSYATFSPHNAYWRGIIFEWGLANVIGSAEKGIVGSPWFGIGINDWVRPGFMHSGSMDNFWLVMAVRYGLPGFLLLAVGYILVIAKVMRRDFTADPVLRQIRRAWVFTMLGLSFTLSTVHVWSSVYSFIVFIFATGIWLITAQQVSTDTTQKEQVPSRDEHQANAYSRFPIRAPRRPPQVPETAMTRPWRSPPPSSALSSAPTQPPP